MNNEKLKELLDRIPFGLLIFLYAGYLGYDYWSFTHSPESPLLQKQVETEGVKKENQAIQAKIHQANEFYKTIDAKRAEIRQLAQSLGELKVTLASEVDVPGFMKLVNTEATRVGLRVVALKPKPAVKKEYYQEQPFELSFRGVYVQLLMFLDHLANVQSIVRADNIEIKPKSSVGQSKFTEIEGTVRISAYEYVSSTADEVVKAKHIAAATESVSAPGGGK